MLAFTGPENWEPVYFAGGTGQFADAVNRTEQGALGEQQLQLFYPGGDRPDMTALMQGHKVLRLKYYGMDPFVVGNPQNPWLVTASFSLQAKGYTLNFTRKDAK